jgi:hypothetical protein
MATSTICPACGTIPDAELTQDWPADMPPALRDLGNAEAATPFGAIEHLAMQTREGMDAMASALGAASD